MQDPWREPRTLRERYRRARWQFKLRRASLADRLTSRLRGNPWRFERGVEPASIAQIVSPLRYDILIRLRHFEFLRDHEDLLHRDLEGYVDAAMEEDYFVWFSRAITGVFSRPDAPESPLQFDADDLRGRFKRRLGFNAALYQRVQRDGFSPEFPVTLLGGDQILPTVSGKQVDRPFYAGDGCHRIALHLLSGARTIAPELYRIKRYRSYRPLDNTHVLLGAIDVHAREYLDFLAMSYAEGPVESRADLLARTECLTPHLVGELREVLAADEPLLVPDA